MGRSYDGIAGGESEEEEMSQHAQGEKTKKGAEKIGASLGTGLALFRPGGNCVHGGLQRFLDSTSQGRRKEFIIDHMIWKMYLLCLRPQSSFFILGNIWFFHLVDKMFVKGCAHIINLLIT